MTATVALEVAEYAADAMLATRISFMNELASLAESLGVGIQSVRRGIGLDSRIGYSFLYTGCGHGESRFPKDLKALVKTGEEHDHALSVLRAVQAVNDAQKDVLAAKTVRRLGEELGGRPFALWGLAFKPDTDRMREAPSRSLIDKLLRRGARIIATEWKEFGSPDFAGIRTRLRTFLVFDGCNHSDLAITARERLMYLAIGRPPVTPPREPLP